MNKRLPDHRIRLLAKKWLEGSSTPEERAEFMQWYNSQDDRQLVPVPEDFAINEEAHKARMLEAIEERLTNADAKRYELNFNSRRLWPAAAAIICLLALGAYFMLSRPAKRTEEKMTLIRKNDVPAIGNKAILTLDNGKEIILDSNHRGELASQGNSSVIKTGSNIITYNPTSVAQADKPSLTFNTLTTPRGGQFRVTLADGTKVWLNAASSIRYPTAFTDKDRVVEITGEAYFEVAKDVSHPFRVKVNSMQIEVLGTHFNVMAYNNEKSIQTTLLEGSVKIIREEDHLSQMLRPGEQARVSNQNGTLMLIPQADVKLAIAWKDGVQAFRNADIETIMREVERWYDVDVIYKGKVPQRSFSGEIPRDASLTVLLKLFEVNKIHFTIDAANKKLTVLP